MSPSERLNVGLSFVTAVSASYLAFAALVNTTRPRASVVLINHTHSYPGERVVFVFSFKNVGHWYAKPMIVNMTIYINFDSAFDLVEMRSGSTQQNISTNAKIGKGNMKYFKSKGMHLSFGEDAEEIHVVARVPKKPGEYRLKVSAFSENDASLSKVFSVHVLSSVAGGESQATSLDVVPEP